MSLAAARLFGVLVMPATATSRGRRALTLGGFPRSSMFGPSHFALKENAKCRNGKPDVLEVLWFPVQVGFQREWA